MLRNYLASALHNLARNKIYSAIGIFGLAIGIGAALLSALIIRNELTYDAFIPNFDRTFLVMSRVALQAQAPAYNPQSHKNFASLLKLNFPQIEATTRITSDQVFLHRGQIQAFEKIYWADPNVFDLLPLPIVTGDLNRALQRPDGMVLTRSVARKYFGRDNVVGETIELGGTHLMTITAVIEDLPPNGTQFDSGIFASGLASYSKLTLEGGAPPSPSDKDFYTTDRTYLRLVPNASIENLQKAMPAFLRPILPPFRIPQYSVQFVRLDRVHLFIDRSFPITSQGYNQSVIARLAVLGMTGLLILLVACTNSINLSTARSMQRALEIGVRKVSGATRGALISQFLIESLIHVALATCIAVALAELLLPYVNALLDSGAVIDYWRDPALIIWVVLAMLVLSVLAGFGPAFAISAFRPMDTLKGRIIRSRSAGATRQMLVILQFSTLIGLIIACGIVYEQRVYSTKDALRIDTNPVLNLFLGPDPHVRTAVCEGVFNTEVRRLSGVRDVSCSSGAFLDGISFGKMQLKDGSQPYMVMMNVEASVFALYGLRPVAGRFLDAVNGEKARPHGTQIVINETAVHQLGFTSPSDAVGRPASSPEVGGSGSTYEIIGVVPDFSLFSVEKKIQPTIFILESDPTLFGMLSIKLAGYDIPETLAAIDRMWPTTGATTPIDRFFLSSYIENLYLSVLREAQVFGILSCMAIGLACLGLVGLAGATAERRTKEIGIRKSMGASTGDILRLLTWEFAKPVLWANLIAWPVAYYAMNRWLAGYAYHIDLAPWMFFAAGALALAIALATVSVQSYLVARAKPVEALRYE